MKKTILTLCIGMVIGAFAIVSTGALAIVGDHVDAVFADFNYVVNGVPKTIGSPALVYLGKSYIPTTEVANMLDNDVTYKADSRTILFNHPEPIPTGGITTPVVTLDPNATPTPAPTPDPVTGEIPSAPPNALPSATPSPTLEPTPTPYTGPVAPGGDNGRYQMCMSLSPGDVISREMYQCSFFGL